jgi:hypothetical protein
MSVVARRLFTVDGREIYRREDINANEDYFVSSGENFKDPYRPMKSKTIRMIMSIRH